MANLNRERIPPIPKSDLMATDWDHRVITAVSAALDGQIGRDDDVHRLRDEIENGPSRDKMHTACEIAIAFIRWAQDLKAESR